MKCQGKFPSVLKQTVIPWSQVQVTTALYVYLFPLYWHFLINLNKEKPKSQVNVWLSLLSQKTYMVSSCKHTKSQSDLSKLQWRYSFFKEVSLTAELSSFE